jgi:hypothetical protein
MDTVLSLNVVSIKGIFGNNSMENTEKEPENSDFSAENTQQAITEEKQGVVPEQPMTEAGQTEQVTKTEQEVEPASVFRRRERPRGDTIYSDARSIAVKILTRVERTDAY